MFLNTTESVVFGSGSIKLESALKNPNQFREAVLFEALSNLPNSKINEFIKSPEAKHMLSEGTVTPEMIERLEDCGNNSVFKTTVLHMAKEENDPLWDELVNYRMQERRVLNQLIEKYGEKAKSVSDNAYKNFVEKCVPSYFRN